MAEVRKIEGSDVQRHTRVWRYMDLAKLIDLLTTRQLAMPLASMMDDPYEGDVGPATTDARWREQHSRGAPSYWLVADENRQRSMAARIREATYISCWNALDFESAAMWKIYGNDKGIAIESTWDDLCRSLHTDRDIFGGRVQYVDYDHEPLPTATYTDDYFYKRISFSFEHEVRLVSHAEEIEEHFRQSSGDITWPKVLRINADLDSMVHAVYLNPNHGAWVREAVEAVIRKFGYSWDVHQSTLYTPRGPRYAI